jgi:hypothetical protein
MRWRWFVCVVCVGWTMGMGAERSQVGVSTPDASVGAAMRSMALRASAVFVGQVVAIHRKGGVVEVVFRVDTSVAGSPGALYTMREWAGLWPPGMERYQPGERALVYVHGASAAGFSTPVNGAEGVVPVIAANGTAPLLDVSRLATRVQRGMGHSLVAEEAGAMALADAIALVRTCHEPRWHEPVPLPLPVGLRPVARPLGSRTIAAVANAGRRDPVQHSGQFVEASDAQ